MNGKITPKKNTGDVKVAKIPKAIMTSTDSSQITMTTGLGEGVVIRSLGPWSPTGMGCAPNAGAASIIRVPFRALRTPPCIAARASRGPQREQSGRRHLRHERASLS